MNPEIKKPDNPSAFPSEKDEYYEVGHSDVKTTVKYQGMTLRDYFAAKAMSSLLIADGTMYFGNRAKEAYEVADEMLKVRAEITI